MNRRFIITALLMAFVVSAFAQSNEDQKKLINSIKKSKSYLYAEITTNDQQSALDMAEDMLNQEINKYVAEQKKLRNATNIVLRNRQQAMESISLPRGNMFRAFKYVKKSDIIAADNVEVRTNTTTVDEQGKAANVTQTVASTEQPIASTRRTETIAQLLAVKKFTELPQLMKKLKGEERIGQYAKIKELTNPEKSVLLIYNREGNIEAVLSEGPSRVNMKTNQADSEKNYPGRGAFGVVVNN